jgi:glycosyltransferase involved in cell wall biosynthesis
MARGRGEVCLTVYAGPPRGGCYERMKRLVQALLGRGWTVHFVGPVRPGPAHPGLVFHPVRTAGRGQPSLRTLARCISTAAAVCVRHRIRYVWSFGTAYAALLAPLVLLPQRRMATFLRGSLEAQEQARGAGYLRRAVVRAVERTAVVASGSVIAVSGDLAGRAGSRATFLPNDARVPTEAWRPEQARQELGLPRDAFLVGYAGSITPIKSLETLVHMASLLPAVHLALQGFSETETAYERALRALVASRGLSPRSHLMGWAPSAQRFLAALDVVVLPSQHEGCPNILLEAMAMGRPCLGARSGGIQEVLVDDALLFPAGDGDRLAARVKELQEHPEERERLASLGRARAEAYDFDWDERATAALESAFRRDD